MPVCRTCGRTWPADHAACPEDGTRLDGPPSSLTVGSLAPALSNPRSSGRYDDELEAGSFAGEYQIERKIGEGGMGAVYGARHPLIGKRAAIKVLKRELSSNPEAVDRFVREAQAVNQIGHPNIVDVFSFGTLPDGRSFFAMEWLQGESLRSRLERPLRYAEAIDILDTMAKALVAAHDAGVVHRDLKPDNVFLVDVKDDKPVTMLLDFGLAKLTGSTDGRVERTRTGVVMGTPLYISPEQAKGTTIEASTDTYALGAMAYEMFTGRVPFVADSAVEIMSLHITQAPIPPTTINPELPAAVDRLVLGMMTKEPSGRPTLSLVRKQLAELRGLAVSSAPVGSSASPGQWPVATPTPTSYAAANVASPAVIGRSSSPAMAPGSMAPGSMAPGSMAPGSMPGAAFADSSISAPVKRGRSIGLILGVAVLVGGAAVAAFVMLGKKSDRTVVASNDVASGSATTASGSATTASGSATTASGSATTASGSATTASGSATTASGSATTASGSAAVTASGSAATASGASSDSAEGSAATEKPVTAADAGAGSGEAPIVKSGTGTTRSSTTKSGTTRSGSTGEASTDPLAGGGSTAAKSTAPGKVKIVLSGAPRGAIFVDGKLIGRGLSQAAVVLAPGAHRIRGQAPGFGPQFVSIELKPGATQNVTISLKRGGGGVNGVLDPFGNDN